MKCPKCNGSNIATEARSTPVARPQGTGAIIMDCVAIAGKSFGGLRNRVILARS